MSRIGKKPVVIPNGVQVTISGPNVKAKGPLGELQEVLPGPISAEVKGGEVLVSADLMSGRNAKALYGTSRARINNAVLGVSAGFSKEMSIVGLGYRAEADAKKITLSLGKSHPVLFTIPDGIKVKIDPKKTLVTISGINKDLVGTTAARLRALKRPEPYKGTGIRYKGEVVRRKAGKTAAGAGVKK